MYNMLESRLQLTEAVEMYLRGTQAQELLVQNAFYILRHIV